MKHLGSETDAQIRHGQKRLSDWVKLCVAWRVLTALRSLPSLLRRSASLLDARQLERHSELARGRAARLGEDHAELAQAEVRQL